MTIMGTKAYPWHLAAICILTWSVAHQAEALKAISATVEVVEVHSYGTPVDLSQPQHDDLENSKANLGHQRTSVNTGAPQATGDRTGHANGAARRSMTQQLALLVLTFDGPVEAVRMQTVLDRATGTASSCLQRDDLAMLGLFRLQCGGALFESHPFPDTLGAAERAHRPPFFLIPVPRPRGQTQAGPAPSGPGGHGADPEPHVHSSATASSGARTDGLLWHSSQAVSRLLLQRGRARSTSGAPSSVMFVLNLHQSVTAGTRNGDSSDGTPPSTMHFNRVTAAELNQCRLHVLHPTQQTFVPSGAMLAHGGLSSVPSLYCDHVARNARDGHSLTNITEHAVVDQISHLLTTDSLPLVPADTGTVVAHTPEQWGSAEKAALGVHSSVHAPSSPPMSSAATTDMAMPTERSQDRILQRLVADHYANAFHVNPFAASKPFFDCNPVTYSQRDMELGLVETSVSLQARNKMYERILAKNPLSGAMKGVTGAVGGALGGPIGNMFDGTLIGKLLPGLQSGIMKILTEQLVPGIAPNLPPAVAEMVPARIAELMPPQLIEAIVTQVVERMTPVTTRKVVRGIAIPIAQKVDRETPRRLTAFISPGVVSMLSRTLAHTITPAYRYTLTYTARAVRCYYCDYSRKHPSLYGTPSTMCGGCPADDALVTERDKRVEDSLFYAGYYSKYYSSYYADMDFKGLDDAIQNAQTKKDYYDNNKPEWIRQILA